MTIVINNNPALRFVTMKFNRVRAAIRVRRAAFSRLRWRDYYTVVATFQGVASRFASRFSPYSAPPPPPPVPPPLHQDIFDEDLLPSLAESFRKECEILTGQALSPGDV